MPKQFRWLSGVGLTCLLLLAYNNCSQGPFALMTVNSEDFASNRIFFSGSCEAELMNLYANTYRPFLTNSCASCHTNGPGIGAFGSADFQVSYDSFKSIGRDKIHRQSLNAGHQPGITGPQNADRLDPYPSRWLAAEASYESCRSQEPDYVPTSLLTLHKANAQILQRANANQTNWTRLEWDLTTEAANSQQRNLYPMILGIEARVAVVGGVRRGYEFRNPTARLKAAGGGYTIKGLRLSINDAKLVDVTTFATVNMGVPGTTDVNLAPGSAFALAVMEPVLATDRFAIEVMEIANGAIPPGGGGGGGPTEPEPSLPTSVSWTQLTSNDATLGVFRQSCLNCHGATNPSAGLNLLDYAKAKAAANEIMSRMNNANNPMPTSGLLSNEKRELIRIWVQGGAAQ
ncbi:MAG: hypothetical protein KF802_08885 [Bdellovibrionaceae bacterium]|nr:hypothetical protein [Pseudobdellovibrionaceae bacterium]MBX3034164.1 hypothetical protein [Pseudobdellovibrionaceae bacterium]